MPNTENPLFFSASLAQTIGLNESILLQFLQQHTALTNGQFQMTQAHCQQFFSFWDNGQVHQVFINLQGLGLIELNQSQGGQWVGQVVTHFEPSLQKETSKVFNPTSQESIQTSIVQSASSIDVPQMQSPQESMPIDVPALTPTESVIVDVPVDEPVDRANEARLYNQNRGNPLGHLQQPKSTPIYSQSNNALSKMNQTWKPSEQFHEMLRLHNIPAAFAQEQLPVFKQYYIDSGKTAMSWDSRFINWVQRAKVSLRTQEGQYEQKSNYSAPGLDAKQRKEEVRQKLRDINDTSWAD